MKRTAFALPVAIVVSSLLVGCGGRGNASGASRDGGGETDGTTPDTGARGSGGDAAGAGLDGGASGDTDAWTSLPPTPEQPQLWYWHHSYLSPTSAVEPRHSEQLIDEAADAG